MKLLIVPWGNPFTWEEVKYRFGNTICTSKTSLCVLTKELNPDRILILVGDSLAKSEKVKENSEYASIKKTVEEEIKLFLSENVYYESHPKVDICVLPGTGYFPNGAFEGQVLDYYYRLLYELADIISKDAFSEVHLDLTHGLNFMPVLTYRAVKEILQVVSFFKSVKFTAYNADPFVSGVPETVLTLHVVEETEEDPRFPSFSPYVVDESSRFFEKLAVDENGQKLKVVEKPWLKEVLTFVGGINFGLPLVLITFFVPSEKILSHLEEALENYERKIEIRKDGNRLRLRRKARLTPLFRVLTLSWLLLKLFEKEDLLKERREEISLNEFESLAKKVFWKDINLRSILGREIDNLKKIKDFSSHWELWAKIDGKKPGSPDPRNFFAHGGLEKNAVELCNTEEGLALRYCKDKKDTVQKFVLKVLR